MGREATCRCVWGGTTANVKALLESRFQLSGRIRQNRNQKVAVSALATLICNQEVA